MAKKTTSTAKEQSAVIEFQPGQMVIFKGYDESVPADERILTEGESYKFVEYDEVDGVRLAFVQAPNPDFDEKKKEHAENNPRMIEVDAMPEELELAADDGAAAEAEPAAEAPAKPAGKGRAKATPAAEAAAEAPAKPAGKGKAAAKTEAPAKPATKTAKAPAKKAAPAAEAEGEDGETPIELEGEDEAVLQILADNPTADDLIAAAQGLEADVAVSEYRLGGILFHLRNSKQYLEVEGGEAYAENGGWGKFVMDFFNLQYRKAMHLIEIYVNYTQAGIENPAEHVAKVGWSKAAMIATYLNHPDFVEGKTAEQIEKHVNNLLEAAENNTSEDLRAVIKETVSVGGSKTTTEGAQKVTRVTYKMRFTEEDAATVENTLKLAQERLGQNSIEDTVLMILGDWAANNLGGDNAAEQATNKAAAPKGATRRARATAAA